MTSRDFCYWLQGYFELTRTDKELTAAQTETIERHLALVFKHEIDPSIPDPDGKLQQTHDGPKPWPPKPPQAGDLVYRC